MSRAYRDLLLSRAGISIAGGSCTSKIDWPTAVSNVEALQFKESTVDSEYLRKVLGACKSLRHFTLRWPMEVEVEGSGTDVGYSGLLESLSTQKRTLKTLILNSADVDWFGRFICFHLELDPINHKNHFSFPPSS